MLRQTFDQYSDEEIILKIIEGDEALYEILIRRNNPLLYKVGRAYGYNHQDTEDLMQEAYINAFYSLAKFEHRSAFKTWLTRIMLNHCFHKKQKFGFQKEILVDAGNPGKLIRMHHQAGNAEKIAVNKELGQVLESALEQLAEDYKMVFTLRELSGCSIRETAEILEISETNVKVRLNRAKGMLRTKIEKIYAPEDIYEFNLIYCDQKVVCVMNQILSLKMSPKIM